MTEAGAMNFFIKWINEDGEEELVTPPLDGTILTGVTRESILKICSDMNRFKISERRFKIQDVVKAAKENRIQEAFCVGTALIVTPVG